MKRWMAALLVCAVTVGALCACGKNSDKAPAPEDGTKTEAPGDSGKTEAPGNSSETEASDGNSGSVAGETNGQILLADFQERMKDGAPTLEELANGIIGNEIIPFGGAAMAVEPGFLNGFTEEITGFSEGWNFGPMIGTIPFVGYVFRLEDGADADAFMQNLKDKADLRWNICTAADEMVCDAVDNTVFFVMCQAQFEE